jgi:hypothetical protein
MQIWYLEAMTTLAMWPRVSGLANLSEYIDGMEKINYRQGKADDEDGKQPPDGGFFLTGEC